MQNNNLLNTLEIKETSDGSFTLYNPEVDENYHSINGALQESQHVFVDSGLHYYHQHNKNKEIKILEIGFGTGLNFLLSIEFALKENIKLNYLGVELNVLPISLIRSLKLESLVQESTWKIFESTYEDSINKDKAPTESVSLKIVESDIRNFSSEEKFDIIYFDAFAKSKQAEMWTKETIEHVCSFLKDKGIFVTYSVTGELKRNLKSLGFEIERPVGAAGKREMMRATLNHVIQTNI